PAPADARLFTVYEVPVDRFIRAMLARNKMTFGGFYHTHFPTMHFMNAAYGLPRLHFEPFLQSPKMFPEDFGKCYFWMRPLSEYFGQKFLQSLREYELDPAMECASYYDFSVGYERQICGVCKSDREP